MKVADIVAAARDSLEGIPFADMAAVIRGSLEVQLEGNNSKASLHPSSAGVRPSSAEVRPS